MDRSGAGLMVCQWQPACCVLSPGCSECAQPPTHRRVLRLMCAVQQLQGLTRPNFIDSPTWPPVQFPFSGRCAQAACPIAAVLWLRGSAVHYIHVPGHCCAPVFFSLRPCADCTALLAAARASKYPVL
jgi:hypothetical protein